MGRNNSNVKIRLVGWLVQKAHQIKKYFELQSEIYQKLSNAPYTNHQKLSNKKGESLEII